MDDKRNQVSTITGGLKLQDQLLGELNKAAESMGQDFTEHGKKCVINAIAQLVIITKQQGYGLDAFDPTLVRLALQNVGYTELNIAAIPSECYFEIRNGKDNKKTIAIKPQGAGNEKLLRTYGVNVKEVRPAWLVREGDEFTNPSYNGLDVVPPKWTPKSFDKKVIMVVYPVIKNDNSVEYLIATREGVKPNIIAQIRQNCLYDKNKEQIYKELEVDAEKMSVDELLACEKWAKLVNPTYTSGGSKEAMILRKMKNNAMKNYPKDYKDAYMADAVKNMFEDKDDSLNIDPAKVIDADPIEKVEQEINEKTNEDAVPDFDVDGVVKEEPKEVKEPEEGYGF